MGDWSQVPDLKSNHAKELEAHAILPEVAARNHVRSATSRGEGIIFPARGRNGELVNVFRPDDPKPGKNGKLGKYLWDKDTPLHIYVTRDAGPDSPIILCEGTCQPLAVASWAPPDYTVLGMNGCRGWAEDPMMFATGRDLFAVFDGDIRHNRDVWDAASALDELLAVREVASLRYVRVPVWGKKRNGIDDLLFATDPEQRAATVKLLLDQAVKKPGKAPARKKHGETTVPEGTEVLPDPTDPMAVARVMEPGFRAGDGGAHTLRRWRGGWWQWKDSRWSEVELAEISAELYRRTEHARYQAGQFYEKWAPTKVKVANLSDALTAILLLDQQTSPPTWIDGAEDPGSVIACRNGLLRLCDRELLPHDARFFNLTAVPFAYDPAAPAPAEWLSFLNTVWPGGGDGQVDTLQEWFGYLVSGRADLQKMLAIVGPPRSGKGTIAGVATELVGKPNTAGPTLASLGTNFGLSSLLGKSMAVISDARLSGQSNRELVVERLLTISGQDHVDVDRKHLPIWSGTLPVRVMLMSNELPRFADASGTIASRFLVLQHVRSFLGAEDLGLKARLMAELPGILNWALAGLDRLLAAGHFGEPQVSADLVLMMRETASPTAAFVADECVIGDAYEVASTRAFEAWEFWCQENGRDRPGTVQWFGRDLKAVAPGLTTAQPKRPDGSRYRLFRGMGLRNDYPGSQNTPEPQPGTRGNAVPPIARVGDQSSEDEDIHNMYKSGSGRDRVPARSQPSRPAPSETCARCGSAAVAPGDKLCLACDTAMDDD